MKILFGGLYDFLTAEDIKDRIKRESIIDEINAIPMYYQIYEDCSEK